MSSPTIALGAYACDSFTLPRCAADLGFPSPADEDITITTPALETDGLPCGITTTWSDPDLAIVTPAEPQPTAFKSQQAVTPMQEIAPSLPLDAIVGAAINPVPSLQPATLSPTQVKAGLGLRLPSFEALAMARPHPGGLKHSIIPFAQSPFLGVGADVSAVQAHRSSSFDDISSPHSKIKLPNFSQHVVTTLTPPDDNGRLVWESITATSGRPVESPMTDVGQSSAASPADQAPAASSLLSQPRVHIRRSDSDMARGSWLEEAGGVIMAGLRASPNIVSPVKVLSHALPCPSNMGFAFPVIVNSLHNQTPGSPTCWINVFHALPGRFTLSDLPTSPPNTPGPAIGGDDYFTSKIFDSAVPILDYQQNLKSLPKSPRPVVPPSSINVSIVERYIPPTSDNEFAEMFDIQGRSLLMDRLVELSPSNGTLLFIYPTKAGARTFVQQYLGPILDPLLRSMCIVNSLSVDLGAALGKMNAVESMSNYENLRDKIAGLCDNLSGHDKAMSRFHGRTTEFSLDYAAKQSIKLDRKVWAENWWVKQEKQRLREVLSYWFRMAKNFQLAHSDVNQTNLLHEILDGVTKRSYGDRPEPSDGIEVGIFVIKRSA